MIPSAAAAERSDCLRSPDRLLRLVARQRQQLLDQMDGAFDRRAQAHARFDALGLVRRAIEQLQLQPQCRQRRAQFVRRIGDEGALRSEGLLQPLQQPIQFTDQRLRFPAADWRCRAASAMRASRRCTSAVTKRNGASPRRTIHATARDHDGQQQHERNDHPFRGGARQGFAHPHRLRDLNHAIRRLQPVGPPGLRRAGQDPHSREPFD